jgi:hypothetical protein
VERKFQRTNVLGALCGKDMLAHFCYAQVTTGEFFEQWFKKSLLSTVKKGCTIIMDNASFHRKKRLEEIATERQVKLLFLPPYSPDFKVLGKFETCISGFVIGFFGCCLRSILLL